jgi:hypothetical protein
MKDDRASVLLGGSRSGLTRLKDFSSDRSICIGWTFSVDSKGVRWRSVPRFDLWLCAAVCATGRGDESVAFL